MKNEYIIVLGASYNQLPAISAVKTMGYKCISIDANKDSPGFKYADLFFVRSILDFDYIYEIGKRYSVKAIVTTASEKAMITIAEVNPRLGLISPSTETIIKATNKAEMRKCFKENGVPCPEFLIVNNYVEFKNAVKHFDSDCISKSANNSGKRGIVKISKFATERQLSDAYNYSLANSTSKLVVIEEVMKGPEYSVESITFNGKTNVIAITGRNIGKPPHFLEEYHYQPAHVSKQIYSEIRSVVVKAIKSIGLTNGASHTEVMCTKKGVKVVEIGARLGGDNITSSLTPLSTGVDITKAMVEVYLGLKPHLRRRKNGFAAIQFFFPKPGKIKCIQGIDEIAKIKDVIEYQINLKDGDIIKEPIDNQDRVGFVTCIGNNFKIALENCRNALDQIKIIYDKD